MRSSDAPILVRRQRAQSGDNRSARALIRSSVHGTVFGRERPFSSAAKPGGRFLEF